MGPLPKISELYAAFDRHSPFSSPEECEGCPVICARKRNVRWLLPEEVHHLRDELNISKTGNAYFFDGGPCPNFEEGKCKIYEKRPLQCRLNPLTIHEVEGELCWAAYKICHRFDREINLHETLLKLAEKIEHHIGEERRGHFREISSAIRKFDPFSEGELIMLRKLHH